MKKNEAGRIALRLGASIAAGALATSPAMAQGLQQAQSITQSFLDQIQIIGPIVFTIIVILTGVGYGARMVEKDTFVRVAVGCIIAGSASALVPMFWSGS